MLQLSITKQVVECCPFIGYRITYELLSGNVPRKEYVIILQAQSLLINRMFTSYIDS
jgi:hypothetical protein